MELSIEEKARRYDEAIEKLRSLHGNYDTVSTLIDIKEEFENIFPELKESREDEMIRVIKEVILNSVPYKINILTKDTTITAEEAIAWLEKQGEQKPAWSEENEKTLVSFLHKLGICELLTSKENCWIIDSDKLKTLKERCTWKPSDEQMKALNYVVNLMASSESPKENDYYYNVFNDLREQLKKLREE